MATVNLSAVITPSNVLTDSNTVSGITNKSFTSPTFVTPALGTPASGVATNLTGLPLTTGVTGTLPVANGGTGAATLTANYALLGNGTSALQMIAPGSSGNLLTSNGTTWASTAPAGGSAATPTALGTVYGKTNTGSATAIGYEALASTTTAENVGVGYRALYANTSGASNTAMGHQSSLNSVGNNNSSFGYQSLPNNQASNNTAVGYQAMYSNTTGTSNVSLGYYALRLTTTGSGNTAVGYTALRDTTTATNNTGIGYGAGAGMSGNGSENVLVGYNAGNYYTTLDSGSQNVCVGTNVSTGSNNSNASITIGYQIQGQGTGYVTLGSPSGKIYNLFTTNATWTQTSDVRLKTNIENDSLGLSFINRLRTVKFNWKPSNEIDQSLPQYSETNIRNTETVIHGLIAQEVKAALDAEGVSTFAGWDVGLDGVQAISREMFISPLIKAIQEQQAIIESLKARLDAANL